MNTTGASIPALGGVAPTVSAPHTAAPSAPWVQRLPLSLAIVALFGWLLWSVSARQALLLMVGVGLGGVLAGARFGFTAGWRNLLEERDPTGVYGQILLLALLALFSMPILAHFPETSAALGPPSVSLFVGAFVFGACMPLAAGCGSGTLFNAGLGNLRNMAVLPLFVLGSFAGSVQLNDWLALGALPGVGLVERWGVGVALPVTLAGLALLAFAVGRWSGQPLRLRQLDRRWVWGAAGLAILATLNLLISGQPWGVVYGFGLWGAKAATALGLFDPTLNAFWSDPGHAQRLQQTLLMDVTSITDIGILAGALWISYGRPRPQTKLKARQWAVTLVAGFLLGYSSRLAFGCNIGALVSGISTGSVHGWIWMPMAFMGAIAGLRVRRLFF